MNSHEDAKKRIWNKLSARLPEREMTTFSNELHFLEKARASLPLNRLKQVQMKEQLLENLSEQDAPVSFWKSLFQWSPALAPLAVFFLVFVPVLLQDSEPNSLVVGSIEGEAWVLREGEVFEASEGFDLLEGDILHSKEAGLTVNLMDQTELTLGNHAVVEIYRIQEDLEAASLQAVLKQHQGEMWTQVSLLENEASYVIVEFPEGYLEFHQAAAVNLHVTSEKTLLEVAQNYVEVHFLVEKVAAYTGSIVAGDALLIDFQESSPHFEIAQMNAEDMSRSWWIEYGPLLQLPEIADIRTELTMIPLEISQAN